MADGTRLRTLEENLKRVEAQLVALNGISHSTAEGTGLRKLEENLRRVEAQLAEIGAKQNTDISVGLRGANSQEEQRISCNPRPEAEILGQRSLNMGQLSKNPPMGDQNRDSGKNSYTESFSRVIDRNVDVGCQGLSVLEATPTKFNWEINSEVRDLSFSNKFEFGDNNPSLNLELPVFGELIWARQCEKYSRNYEITGAHILFDEMSKRGFSRNDYSVQLSHAQMQMANWVFDPGSAKDLNNKYYRYLDRLQRHFESCYAVIFDGNSQGTDVSAQSSVDVNAFEYDCFGANLKGSRNWIVCAGNSNSIMANDEPTLMPFDRGKSHTLHSYFSWEVQSNGIFFHFGLFKRDGIVRAEIANQRLQWDPGGVFDHGWFSAIMIELLRFLES